MLNFSDDFVQLIHQTDKQRKKDIQDKIYDEKLLDFHRADEIDKELADEHKSRKT